jgi:hypothetical protein
MKTTNTQKKSSKRTRAAPDHTNQLTEIPAQPVEVLSPRQTLVQTVCSLTGTKEAQAMQIASNHLYDYCLMPDKEVAEFVGHLEAIELLCDCLAFGNQGNVGFSYPQEARSVCVEGEYKGYGLATGSSRM